MDEKSVRGFLCNTDFWKLGVFGENISGQLLYSYTCLQVSTTGHLMELSKMDQCHITESFWLGKNSKIIKFKFLTKHHPVSKTVALNAMSSHFLNTSKGW